MPFTNDPVIEPADHSGVPKGTAVPEKTPTVIDACSWPSEAVRVALPGATAVTCGGSVFVILTIDGSLTVQVAPETDCPRSPTSLIERVFPTTMFAVPGVMKIPFGVTGLYVIET